MAASKTRTSACRVSNEAPWRTPGSEMSARKTPTSSSAIYGKLVSTPVDSADQILLVRLSTAHVAPGVSLTAPIFIGPSSMDSHILTAILRESVGQTTRRLPTRSEEHTSELQS